MAEEIVLSDRNVPRPPLQEELTRLYSQGFLTDITLSTEDGKNFEAHKVLLAARSHYFHSVVPRLKSDPVIFLKGVKGAHLDKILKFIYSGTCALSRHQLKPILEVAKSLQIKGLCDANPTDILQQQQPSALGASRFRNSESGGGGASATSPTSLTGGVSAALQRMQQQQNRLSSSSASSSPGSNAGGNLVDKTTSTTFKTPTGVARRSMTSAGSSNSKSAGPSSSMSGNKSSQNSLLNGSPANSDSEGEDSKTGKDDSDDDEKGRSSPSSGTRQSKRKRGRPPKHIRDQQKADQASGSNGKNSKGSGSDPYDFDDDNGNDPSGSAGENATSGDEKQSESTKKNEWRVDESGNLLQVNEAITKSEMDTDEGQDGNELGNKEVIEKKPSKYATTSINGMQILPVKCQNQTAELHLPRFANGMRGQSIKYKEEWMTPGEFEMACGLTGKSKYLDNIQTDYGPLKTLTASGLLKPHSRKCRCSICRGEYESPEKIAKRKRQRELQDQAEAMESSRLNDMGDGINDLDRDDNDGDDNFLMVNSHFQAKEEKDDSMLDDMLDQHNSFDDASHHHNSISNSDNSMLAIDAHSSALSIKSDGDVGSAKRKKKKHKKDEWKKQLVNDQIVKAGANAALAHANAAAAAQAHAAQANMTVMNSSMTIASMNNGIISNDQDQHDQQQSLLASQSFMADNGMSLGGTAVTFSYSANEVMPPKISSPAILTNVNDPRIEPPQMQQPPTFYVMSPHPHANVTAPPTPQHNPFAGLTMPPAPPTPTPQIQMSPAPPQLLPPQVQQPQQQSQQPAQQATAQQNNVTNAVTKYSQDNVSNHVQSSPSSTSSAGSATIKTSASNTSTTQADKNSASDVNKYTGVKKLGAVMNVRCKSTTAILYSNKYETGSKGKCIQLGDEWLTPNEFEDRAGSKAKKYLSSIKCMGRPLRVYVNSGELKGTGPPPPPKAPRKPPQSHANKTPTTIQPIAPAPPPGGVAQLTYTMAPPTPTHISNAPSLPPNLNMMMGNQGPPILINQTSMSGTNLIGSQPILTTPMTFTLAQPLEVRQNVSQAM